MQKSLQIEGMDCSSCALGIERYLKKQNGVKDVQVSFANKEASFIAEETVQIDELINGIEKLGFEVIKDDEKAEDLKALNNKISWINIALILCIICTTPLLLAMFFPNSFLMQPLVQLLFCIPVFIIGCMQFGKNSIQSLRAGYAHMDVLIFTGILLSFCYSIYGIFVLKDMKYMFFETTATITTLVLLGNWIEKKAVKRTTDALDSLYQKQDYEAQCIDDKGNIFTKKMKSIRARDLVLCNKGDMIPCDGVIQSGNADIDESMMNGEPLPISKSINAEVFAGTMMIAGSIQILSSKNADKTYLSELIQLTQKTLREKAPIQRLADRLTSWFVPVVFGLMILAFLINYFLLHQTMEESILRSIAVAVISCPCAMGLATPTAVMVGLGRAFQKGILIKGAETFEKLSQIKNFVFDKTGTLTEGKFKVEKINAFEIEMEELLDIIYTLEKKSSHPIAVSLTQYLNTRNEKTFSSTEEIEGLGMIGKTMDGDIYEIGSHKILEDKTQVSNAHIFITRNKIKIGEVFLEDKVKENAKEALSFLQENGKNVYILSGDKKENVEKLAHTLGVKNFYFDVKPKEKYEIISKLQNENKTAMIGDGINDSISLTKADVGISFSNSSDIAMQSAQVILNNTDFNSFKEAYTLSQKTVSTIKQNLFWAVAYNIVAIPLAAFGFLNPMLAATCMIFSDIIVIGNSILLKYKKV